MERNCRYQVESGRQLPHPYKPGESYAERVACGAKALNKVVFSAGPGKWDEPVVVYVCDEHNNGGK